MTRCFLIRTALFYVERFMNLAVAIPVGWVAYVSRITGWLVGAGNTCANGAFTLIYTRLTVEPHVWCKLNVVDVLDRSP